MSRWAWLATFAIGCGHPSAPAKPGPGSATPVASADAGVVEAPVPLEDDLPRLAERAVKIYLEWQAAFEKAGTDCALATTKLNAIADANTDFIDANRRLYKGSRERVKALREELAKHEEQLNAAAKAIVESPTMSACAKNKEFEKAVDRLGGEG